MNKIQKTIGLVVFLTLASSYFLMSCKSEKSEIESQVKNLLKKYRYIDAKELSFYEGSNIKIATFDDNYATFTYRELTSISSSSDDTEMVPYKILIDDSSKIHLELTSDQGEKSYFKFIQNKHGQTHLVGKLDLWANDDEGDIISNLDDIINPSLKKIAFEQKTKDSLQAIKNAEQAIINAKNAEIERIRIANDTLPEFTDTVTNFKYVILENLKIMKDDLTSEPTTWETANILIDRIGNGWRLPNKEELILIYKNKTKIKGFNADPSVEFGTNYMGSRAQTDFGDGVWVLNSESGYIGDFSGALTGRIACRVKLVK
jgi:hypothetical protein